MGQYLWWVALRRALRQGLGLPRAEGGSDYAVSGSSVPCSQTTLARTSADRRRESVSSPWEEAMNQGPATLVVSFAYRVNKAAGGGRGWGTGWS